MPSAVLDCAAEMMRIGCPGFRPYRIHREQRLCSRAWGMLDEPVDCFCRRCLCMSSTCAKSVAGLSAPQTRTTRSGPRAVPGGPSPTVGIPPHPWRRIGSRVWCAPGCGDVAELKGFAAFVSGLQRNLRVECPHLASAAAVHCSHEAS